jgi:hypothetical protein
MMAEGHRQRRREASLIAPSTPAKSIKAGIIKTVAPGFAVLPHRFAIWAMKTLSFSSSLSEAWGGGPLKAVEGPRGSAEATFAASPR